MIVGNSGTGKSKLALQLIALGANLVADDRCDLSNSSSGVLASHPKSLPQAIEARGIGLLSCPCIGSTMLAAVLDLNVTTQERLPALRYTQVGSHRLPLLHSSAQTHMPSALFHFLKHGFHVCMDE
jgi:HPr kinase/phosphorylase